MCLLLACAGLCALARAAQCVAAPRDGTVNQTSRARSQWRLARQAGTCGDTEGSLFCGFRLHKHHYHFADLELASLFSGNPNFVGNLELSHWKMEFSLVSGVCGMCGMCGMSQRG